MKPRTDGFKPREGCMSDVGCNFPNCRCKLPSRYGLTTKPENQNRLQGKREWKRVVFAADCGDDGNCPVCNIDYAECSCPGPTMEDHEYKTVDGVLLARGKENAKS